MTPTTTNQKHSFVVAQIGARRHYAVPRALASTGQLAFLYTDICAASGWPIALSMVPKRFQPHRLRKLLERKPEGIPASNVRSFPAFGLHYGARLRWAKNDAARYATFLWGARRFNELVVKAGFGDAQCAYTFNSAGLEILRTARNRGLFTVLDQTIAPHDLMWKLEDEEHVRFPDWEDLPETNPYRADYTARNHEEWTLTKRIICGSDFVRDAVVACAGPAARCRVVPYGYDPDWTPVVRTNHGGPLRVLFAGAVGLRKGAPYVLAAAKRMKGQAEFRLVGPVQVRKHAVQLLAAGTDLRGAVSRSELRSHYQWADVFLFPSLCEGSATVTYEALAAGLPVICTPNTGSVVRDGQDGYIIPIRDSEAIVERLERLAADIDLRKTMGESAMRRAAEFSVAKYGESLKRALE